MGDLDPTAGEHLVWITGSIRHRSLCHWLDVPARYHYGRPDAVLSNEPSLVGPNDFSNLDVENGRPSFETPGTAPHRGRRRNGLVGDAHLYNGSPRSSPNLQSDSVVPADATPAAEFIWQLCPKRPRVIIYCVSGGRGQGTVTRMSTDCKPGRRCSTNTLSASGRIQL